MRERIQSWVQDLLEQEIAEFLGRRFDSPILPLFLRQTWEVSDLLPELYLHGLAPGDFVALRGRWKSTRPCRRTRWHA